MSIRKLCEEAFRNSSDKGFWDECDTPEAVDKSIPEKLCLIHSEVSEALECYREGQLGTTLNFITANGKPEGFPSELADVVIRIADLCGALGIDLAHEIEIKMAYNATRERMHGGKTC